MNFHDLVSELGRNVVGRHVETTISRTGSQDPDAYAPIARFEGDAVAVEESISRGRGVQLRIALSPEHKSARAMVEFARDDFVSANVGDQGDEPWDLEVRQASVVISLSVYPPSANTRESEPEARVDETDLPF